MPMDLEWDVIKAPVGEMCRCPNTFVHTVYVHSSIVVVGASGKSGH